MSFTPDEVDTLKGCLREIVDESCFSRVHEMKKKLAISQAKVQEQQEKIDELIKAVEKLNKCHECHKTIVEHRHAYSQTAATHEDT